jgi:hypothetical protein
MSQPKIHSVDLVRYFKAARIIEDDLAEGYNSCRAQFGADLAGLALVSELRKKLNTEPDQWPPPEDLFDKVREFLETQGLYQE